MDPSDEKCFGSKSAFTLRNCRFELLLLGIKTSRDVILTVSHIHRPVKKFGQNKVGLKLFIGLWPRRDARTWPKIREPSWRKIWEDNDVMKKAT